MLVQNTCILIILTNARVVSQNSSESSEQNSYDFPNPVTNCDNGDPYPSLDSCMDECKNIHNVEETSFETKLIEGKMRFKVVALLPTDYTKYSNGDLLTNLPTTHVTANSFVITPNNIAHVCYPLDEDFINCQKWYLLHDEFELRDNSRFLWNNPHKQLYSLGQFFLENVEGELEAGVCLDLRALNSTDGTTKRIVFLTTYSISAVSLITTFILSILIPKLNIRHNYILSCYIVTLAFAYILMVVRLTLTTVTSNGCLALALLKQFSFLASFFWLNVQAVDLFIRFIHLRGIPDAKTSLRRFIIYCIYGWGGPTIICGVTLCVEHSGSKTLNPNFRKNCWFDKLNKMTVFLYFYGPITIILTVNAVLFGTTVRKLYLAGRQASNVNKKMHKQLLKLYMKLIVVMGLCWIMEVMSWAIGGDERNWIFFDVVNALQGFLIFVVYVCKPSLIRKSLYQYQPNWWPWKRQSSRQNRGKDGLKSHTNLSTSTTASGNGNLKSVQVASTDL